MATKKKTSKRKGTDKLSSVKRKKIFLGEAVVVTYANHAELSMTPWDIKFRFGQIQRADELELVIQDTAHIYMSVQHARVFHEVLGKQLDLYETKIAEIPKIGPAKDGGE